MSKVPVRDRPSRYGLFWGVLFLVIVSLSLAGATVYVTAMAGERGIRPRVDLIEPAIAEPGAVVTIRGTNFGSERGDSRVEFAGVSATQSAYRSWSDTEISVRLPPVVDTGLIRVVTKAGESNGAVFMAKSALPVPVIGASGVASGPKVEKVTPESGAIGSLVTITGKDFGASRGGGKVFFTWLADSSKVDSGTGFVTVDDPEVEYEAWTDREIRVRVPDGAATGGLFVSTAKGRSNTVSFAITDMPGRKYYRSRAAYAISYSVTARDVKATGPNDLYLWVPRPVETAWQREVRVLSVSPEPYQAFDRGPTLFRLKDLVPGREARVELRYVVHSWAVETTVDPFRIKPPTEPTPYMRRWLAPDAVVPSADPEIARAALYATGGDRNPYRAAKALYDWILWNVGTASDGTDDPRTAFRTRKANSFGFALLYCAMLRAAGVPALPVSGYLVLPDRTPLAHCWVEFYVYGVGWVPVDPVLGTARPLSTFVPPFTDPRRYFGNVDSRRVAFSRGYVRVAPMDPRKPVGARGRVHSLQEFYEQGIGLDDYSSVWSDIEIAY